MVSERRWNLGKERVAADQPPLVSLWRKWIYQKGLAPLESGYEAGRSGWWFRWLVLSSGDWRFRGNLLVWNRERISGDLVCKIEIFEYYYSDDGGTQDYLWIQDETYLLELNVPTSIEFNINEVLSALNYQPLRWEYKKLTPKEAAGLTGMTETELLKAIEKLE